MLDQNRNGSRKETNTLSTGYGFTGRESDDFTGLMYYRARWYSPAVGRFISEDPIGFVGGGINIYGYVGNSPVMKKDPLGLESPADPDSIYKVYWRATEREREAKAKIIYEAGFDPNNFQCGPSPLTFESHFVRDRIGGLGNYWGDMFEFKPACITHDVCYGDCKSPYQQCNDAFRDSLYKVCDDPNVAATPLDRMWCKAVANRLYFNAVSDRGLFSPFGFGESAYQDSRQFNRCEEKSLIQKCH